jgi:uncharacterized protein (TIGR02145 family)
MGHVGNIIDAATATASWQVGDSGIVTDQRNGQDYCIGKLADGKVWMLDNLKLELDDGMILTSQYTNVAGDTVVDFDWDNFDYSSGPVASYDATERFVTGGYLTYDGNNASSRDAWRQVDPSSEAYCDPTTDPKGGAFTTTNGSLTGCGYLYNWYTATAGSYPQTDFVTPPHTAGYIAPYSICPANWRLPSGYNSNVNLNDFAVLNGAMANEAPDQNTSNDSKYYSGWQPDGSFSGVFSGYWHSGFDNNGYRGSFWSSSVHDVNSARNLYFTSSNVSPGDDYTPRLVGLAVRCVIGS